MPARITILYPQPIDKEKFEQDYKEHLEVYSKHLPDAPTPVVTRVKSNPNSPSPYHLMVTVPFDTMDDLKQVIGSSGMQVVGQHSTSISSGGAPVIIVGVDE